jgi:hypothetical protein
LLSHERYLLDLEKVTLFLCTVNLAPGYEDVLESAVIIPRLFTTGHVEDE